MNTEIKSFKEITAETKSFNKNLVKTFTTTFGQFLDWYCGYGYAFETNNEDAIEEVLETVADSGDFEPTENIREYLTNNENLDIQVEVYQDWRIENYFQINGKHFMFESNDIFGEEE